MPLFARKSSANSFAGDTGFQTDFSQLQNAQFTQFELSNSQGQSQDFFSQPEDIPARPSTEGHRQQYEKYISKPALFRGHARSQNSQNNTISIPQTVKSVDFSNSNSQQQLSIQKARAKERDDRDMLNSIVNIVKECSDEVKHNLSTLKTSEDFNSECLKNSIKSLTERLEESSTRILKALQKDEKNEHMAQINALKKEIEMKDEHIRELIQQKDQLNSSAMESLSSSLEAVKGLFLQQQTQAEKKLQRMLDLSEEHLQSAKEFETCQRQGNKHIQEVKYTAQRHAQDLDKRLADELLMLRDDLERQKRDLEGFFQAQILTMHLKHEQRILKGVADSLQHLPAVSVDSVGQASVLRDICRTQQKELEKYIKTQSSELNRHFLKENKELFQRQQKDMKTKIESKLEILDSNQKQLSSETKTYFEDIKQTLETKVLPWQNNDIVPKKIQEQLNELYDKHQAEIHRLESEMEKQRKQSLEVRTRTVNKPEDEGSMQNDVFKLSNVYDFNEADMDSNRKNVVRSGTIFNNKGRGFLSPRPPQGKWNSRTLFGRANPSPSPVATVFPQRQLRNEGVENASTSLQQMPFEDRDRIMSLQASVNPSANNGGAADDSHTNSLLLSTSAATVTKSKPGRKRGGKRKKKKQEKNGPPQSKMMEAARATEQERNQLVKVSSKPLDVFAFHDPTSPPPRVMKSNRESYNGKSERDSDNSWTSAYKDSDGDSSMNSSPSLSITEIFIRRKVHTDKARVTEDTGAIVPPASFTNLAEMCSTSLEVSSILSQEGRQVRRSTEKRRLCDYDGDVFQIFQAQKRRRY
ncbi:uncharacterized protein LOC127882128 isoform X1 [Dreissena polymorpha]|uniref:uncharacterized protein LOC127882128 isoform X1 n=1 Tax=Dreissena polymorpha TaxID=45954 RepID=UPI002263B296|nr:uncharacterized protein LOC127882128 isoform X1 [Dreissena polymorpha]